MTTAAFGFDSVSFSMQGSRDAYLRELENTTSSATSGGKTEKRKTKNTKKTKKPKLSKKEAAKLREGLNGYQPVQRGNGMPSEGSLQSYNQRMSSYADINSLERKTAEQKALADKALANARRAEQGARFQGVTSEQIDERLGINNKRPLSGAARASYEAKYAADLEKAFLEQEAKSNQFAAAASQVADADDAAAREMRQIAQNAERNRGLAKAGKGTGKVMKFLKSGKGKAAIIGTVVALVATGIGVAACNNNAGADKNIKENKNTALANDNTEEIADSRENEHVSTVEKDAHLKEEKPVDAAAPIVEPPKTEVKESTEKEYTVKRGDSVWNIAKSNLIEKHKDNKDYMPSDKEIIQEVKTIMKDNDLKFESDNYHVMIKPNDKLRLIA